MSTSPSKRVLTNTLTILPVDFQTKNVSCILVLSNTFPSFSTVKKKIIKREKKKNRIILIKTDIIDNNLSRDDPDRGYSTLIRSAYIDRHTDSIVDNTRSDLSGIIGMSPFEYNKDGGCAVPGFL